MRSALHQPRRARPTAVGFLLIALCALTATSVEPMLAQAPTFAPSQAAPSATAVGPTASNPMAISPAAPSSTASSPFDGFWASRPLVRSDIAAALARRGFDDSHLDEWFPDWDAIDYWIFEIQIKDGKWILDTNANGVSYGIGWLGHFTMPDPQTVSATNDQNGCPVTYRLVRTGDQLTVAVTDDGCADPEDPQIQTTVYESSPFTLVQPADWQPTASGPGSTPPAQSSPRATRAPSTSSQRLQKRPDGTVDGAPLGFLEYLPPSYSDDGAASPLLVFLHGSGESGIGDDADLGILANGGIPGIIASDLWPDSRPFVVLSPQHAENPPSYCMESREIDAFLHFALEHYNVDPQRVYLTGLSCGAIGLWNYLADHRGEVVAAAVPIAGYGIGAIQVAGCELARVPIWAFHGGMDDAVAVRGDVYPMTVLTACTDPAPVDARLTVFPTAPHDVWSRTYGGAAGYDIYAWLLTHQKT